MARGGCLISRASSDDLTFFKLPVVACKVVGGEV
jgi:hypothetical protein